MKVRAFLAAAALALAGLGAAPSAEPGPAAAPSATSAPAEAPAAGPAQILGVDLLAAAVKDCRFRVDASLGTLGGGPLTRALKEAARSGIRLRLMLDPQRADTRAQGAALAAGSPTVQVRWRPGTPGLRRWMGLDGARQLVWYAGDRPLPLSSAVLLMRFERDWASADRSPPEALRLNDQLQALPDPREQSPHYVRRLGKNGAP